MIDSDDRPRVERLLRFLPEFESQQPLTRWVPSAELPNGSRTLPWVEFSATLSDFVRQCYEDGWVLSGFDWGAWQEEAARHWNDPTALDDADLATIERLLTLHLRRDRFVEGHLAEAIDRGHMLGILHRLRDLAVPDVGSIVD